MSRCEKKWEIEASPIDNPLPPPPTPHSLLPDGTSLINNHRDNMPSRFLVHMNSLKMKS